MKPQKQICKTIKKTCYANKGLSQILLSKGLSCPVKPKMTYKVSLENPEELKI